MSGKEELNPTAKRGFTNREERQRKTYRETKIDTEIQTQEQADSEDNMHAGTDSSYATDNLQAGNNGRHKKRQIENSNLGSYWVKIILRGSPLIYFP